MLALRDVLVDARSVVEWVATFTEPTQTFGFPQQVALGLQGPVHRATGSKAQIAFQTMVELLRDDAATLATRYAEATHRRLGTAAPPTPLREAMWQNKENAEWEAWRKQEMERARQLAEFGNAIAAEASDLSPEP